MDFAVSPAVQLMMAVLAEHCGDVGQSRDLLDAALSQEIDPLVFCATTFAISQTLVMERAARWAGCAFYGGTIHQPSGRVEPGRLDALATVRAFRIELEGRDIAFASPDFFGLLQLKRRLDDNPALRNRLCLVPAANLRDYLTAAASDALLTEARQGLARRWPFATAQLELTKAARYSFVGAILLLLAMTLFAPFVAEIWLLPFALCLLVGPAAIRLAAVATPRRPEPQAHRPEDEELPVYSVLIPLHNEAQMVPQLFDAMWALDYPAGRLDIKFVVEAASEATVEAVRGRLGDPRVSLVVVPDALPRTKPKALDFALPLCKGEFVVVFDAEDIPDPDQLWRAALRFRDAPDLVCLQAQLVIDNGSRHWLAGLFAGEYAALFSVLLPALARWRLPIPLGGTSNHFRIGALRELGGWDAFNVTEDADLGMRLARRRLRVETLQSRTREHAPRRVGSWLGQRTRWMKGWMQTFIVHNRNPAVLIKEMGLGPAISFELLVLGMIVAPLLHTGLMTMTTIRLLRRDPLIDGHGWPAIYAGIMLLGYLSTLLATIMGLVRTRQANLMLQQALLPIYWLLMAVATLRALHELATRPFHWFKSPHMPVKRQPVQPN